MRMDCHWLEAWLGLPAFRVIAQVGGPQPLDLPLQRRDEHLVCPRCQACCSRVQESRPRCLRDFPILEHPGMLWRPMRRCQGADGRHRPWETRETCGAQVQWTERLYRRVREACLHGCPGRARARRYGLSQRTGLRWTCARSRGGRPSKLGRAIGLDAYARRKGHRANPVSVDVDTGQPLATVKGRGADEGMAWCTSRPQAERDRVDVVVLERSKPCFAAVKAVLGDKVHGIDRFQVVQQAVRARDAVLRSGQTPLDHAEATARKKRRKRWLQSADQRNGDAWIARDEWRRHVPEWRAMMDWGQDWRRWCDRQDDTPAREARCKLIERASQRAQEPRQRVAGTVSRWFEPRVRSIRHRDTNGMPEGFNHKSKLIQRMAYGLRNAHKRRKRLLAWCGAP